VALRSFVEPEPVRSMLHEAPVAACRFLSPTRVVTTSADWCAALSSFTCWSVEQDELNPYESLCARW